MYLNNVIYVSMATKYPIIKDRALFKTLTFFVSASNEYMYMYICQKFLQDTYDHTLMLYKSMTIKGQKSRLGYIGLARCCYISQNEPGFFRRHPIR